MRIISGRARGKQLVEFRGERVRPTADRVREALFSILTSRLGTFSDCNVLDLFAGTGAFALEALSRGAAQALLIDVHPDSLKIIQTNISGCRMSDCAEAIPGRLPDALTKIAHRGPFDLIFVDPPYADDLTVATLKRIDALNMLNRPGVIITETSTREELPERIGDLEQTDRRSYGITALTFYERTISPA